MTFLFGGFAVLVSALIKGAIGFGFPTLATPLLALIIDVKTAVAILVLPNLVMDSLQVRRRGSIMATARRFAVLLAFGVVGTIIGTRVLVSLAPATATFVLGVFILVFVALNATPLTVRVPARWELPLAPPVGLAAGIVGGITNVPGTLLVIYFYALGLVKYDFVRAVALSFAIYKVVQLAALVWFGILTWRLFAASVAITALTLGSFYVGLWVQDRLDQRTFNRVVLVFLAALGLWLTLRHLR